jgi:hypothetical protein
MDKDVHEVSPEELAALDELGRLLEQYQTYLIAGHAFADAARAQASNASGTARPALERLLAAGLGGVPRLADALRIPRTDEDRKTVLEDVEPALKDLRALIAVARRQRHVPQMPMANPAPTASPLGGALQPPPAPGAPTAKTEPRSRMWLWVGGALVVGLILGAFGTELPRSAGVIGRLWVLLEPVVAAGSGGILGELLLREGFRDTFRKRWPTMLVCSILLIGTAPTAVDAALELFTSGPTQTAAPVQQTASPARPTPAAPNPAIESQPAVETKPPVETKATVEATKPPATVGGVPSAGNAAASQSQPPPPAAAVAGRAQRPSIGSPPVTAKSSAARSAECERLLERYQLGELTESEKAILAQDCRK